MSGILGEYHISKSVDYQRFKEALDLTSHRGPDNQSIMQMSQNLFFGHNRLSVIDCDARANQPMQDEKG